ncbi:unnamed protein product [Adineta steineri]|uniref:Uncharacterized protein n=1 Tax=Adineta steineri TaxID=433720 RepID=A0A813WPW9_9BILA|nr:unnamed protein product [Adineta steineri]CAF0986447.1 unnamed protein product [Adineta steineri]
MGTCNTGFTDCNKDPSDGCEINTAADLKNCGSCGSACSFPNAAASCNTGKCTMGACNIGYADCNRNPSDGCEINVSGLTNIGTDINNCGICSYVCSFPNAAASCITGACTMGTCNTGFVDCNKSPSDGCEINTGTDLKNCGSCGNLCSFSNAAATCNNGKCTMGTCNTGFTDCNKVSSDGCEVNIAASATNCGTCNNICSFTNAQPLCNGGTCKMGTCNTGFADCNKNPSDGCEINTAADLINCGSCGNACSFANAAATCNNGKCTMGACNTGFTDCNGDPSDGCEVDTRGQTNIGTDINNCGICHYVCSFTNAAASCITGICTMGTCNTGFVDCNKSPSDGCEINTGTDLKNCGSCGNICSFSNAAATCNNGKCTMGTCNTGFTDCNKDSSDGCEVNTAASITNCGTCNSICSFTNAQALCNSGSCTMGTCNTGFIDCNKNPSDGCEINTVVDLKNCGSCGNICSFSNAAATCNNGKCTMGACNTGFADCNGDPSDGCEVNTRGQANIGTDINNCGICGYVCSFPNAAGSCITGACTMGACNTGFADCNKNPSDGCEVNTGIDAKNCGSCAKTCSLSNAAATCNNGQCTMGTCNMGYTDCDKSPSDGCEINTAADSQNCGTCNNACNLFQATSTCTSGVCTITSCTGGYNDCDQKSANGCESNPAIDVQNCGACKTVCKYTNAIPLCNSGTCTMGMCNSGYSDCDNNPATGCEIQTSSDIMHCGTCTKSCSYNNAAAVCNNGVCAMGACVSGYADCDNDPSTGCETNIAADVNNCGICNTGCILSHATPTCSNGVCTIMKCDSGYTDCDLNPNTGCEINTQTDIKNCGTCKTVCSLSHASSSCSSGICIISSCNTGFGDCDRTAANGCEVNVLTTPTSCGSCDGFCSYTNAAAGCTAGSCTLGTCSTGYTDCNNKPSDGCEINTAADSQNCGTCNNACNLFQATSTCTSGVCTITSCTGGYNDCDQKSANGCESNPAIDVQNCGACKTVCKYTNAIPLCNSGTCTLSMCNSGYGDCINGVSDGCETNTNTTALHCGSCNTACSYNNAAAVCNNGVCALGTCTSGFFDCNLNSADGCEVNLKSDPLNCGSCNSGCRYFNAAAICSSGSCKMGNCNTGYLDCNNNDDDGCEYNGSPCPPG